MCDEDGRLIEFLKAVHLLSLVGAMGMSLASLVTVSHLLMIEPGARSAVAPLMRKFSNFGVLSLGLLWATGLALYAAKYDLSSLTGWFAAKLLVAVALTLLVLTLRWISARAAAAGLAPSLHPIRFILLAVLAAATLTVFSAVLAFS